MDDRQLMASIAGGDEAALQALLQRFTPLFLYVLRPILPDERDREECLADISLRIWQGAGSFDGAKGSLNGWLTALTRNAALNRARAKGTEDAPLEDTVPHGDGSAEDANSESKALLCCSPSHSLQLQVYLQRPTMFHVALNLL